jgi:hypothetical protein
MMHSMALAVPPKAPSILAAILLPNKRVVIIWKGNSINETSFTIQRASSTTGPWNTIATLPSGSISYIDSIGKKRNYYYRMLASNTVGDTATPGFPTMTVDSELSNVMKVNSNRPLGKIKVWINGQLLVLDY